MFKHVKSAHESACGEFTLNKEEADAQADAQAQDNAGVDAFLQPRLERAERAFGQAMTSLWVGNAGAALATLSFIGATWKNNAFPKVLLWPLVLFVLGIIFMGVGALITLFRAKRSIERIQSASSVLDFTWATSSHQSRQ